MSQSELLIAIVRALEATGVPYMPTGDAFDRSRFSRRQEEPILGVDVRISTPEDTVLAKLLWSKRLGGSEKQLGDARRVLEVQGAALDSSYLEEWAQQLGVEELLARIRRDSTSGY